MDDVLTQVLGLGLLVLPLAAIRWNLAAGAKAPAILAPTASGSRWRLELYCTQDDVEVVLADPVDMPFPVKRVRSAKAGQAALAPEDAWTLPRVELDVEVPDPLADDALASLLAVEHRVRFVTGNDAVVDTERHRVRIRSVPHR